MTHEDDRLNMTCQADGKFETTSLKCFLVPCTQARNYPKLLLFTPIY